MAPWILFLPFTLPASAFAFSHPLPGKSTRHVDTKRTYGRFCRDHLIFRHGCPATAGQFLDSPVPPFGPRLAWCMPKTTMSQTDTFNSDSIKIRSGGKRVKAGNKRGQSLIEFTLVMPILLLVMTGMLSFGFALHNYLVLANGVTAGAQVLAISRGQTTDPCATAYAAVKSASLGLTTANLSMTVVINGTTYSPPTPPLTPSCTAGAANMVQGTSAEVAATYPCILAVVGMNFSACKLQMQTVELIQ
jgi:hypothetical protein